MKLETVSRVRSASLGRTRDYERRYRYWTFLLEHLNRLIDEIYQNCEEDESIDECREIILVLQNHIRDFESLIEWLKLNIDLETTPQRPCSVSWEVRKRLPKHPIWSCYFDAENHKTTPGKGVTKAKHNPVAKVEPRFPSDTKSELKSTVELLSSATELQQITESKESSESEMSPLKIEEECSVDKKQVSFNGVDNSLNRCNSLNNLPNRSRKCVLDEDGFQIVRHRQRNKVTRLRIVDSRDNEVKSSADNSTLWGENSTAAVVGDNRAPCRALQLHEKFSSPSRKRSLHDTLRKQEEKQAKAQEAREKLLEEKAGKFKGIVKKVEEIKAQKEEQQLQLKLSMEMRLQRADEKRQQQINKIVRKAHDEDSKVNEILFINSLEADHKKHEIFSKEKVKELRLQDLQEERQRKLEEKASKEAAFEKRRKAIEEEKQARIEKLKEQRKLKVMKIQMQLQEKEKERLELAIQKELDRKSKISALNALHAAEKEELQKKILTKQEESKRRHEENMEQIRQRALELSVRKSSSGVSDDALVCVPYDAVKMCALCKVIIKSEVYLFGHLRGKRHNDAIREQNDGKIVSVEELEDYNLKSIIDASLHPDADLKADCDSEKLKQARKKSKKLKQKIITRVSHLEERISAEQDAHSAQWNSIPKETKYRFSKSIKELNHLHSNDRISGQWPANMVRSLERSLTELEKLFKMDSIHIQYFIHIDGIPLFTRILSRILNGTTERPTSLTDNANNKLVTLYKYLCMQQFDICKCFLLSNNIISMLEILYHRINLCVNSNLNSPFPYDPVVGSLCDFFSTIFERIFSSYSLQIDDKDFIVQHLKDIINYLVIIGVIDKLSMILTSIRGSVNETAQESLFVKQITVLFCSIAKLLTFLPTCEKQETYGVKLAEDETQFMLTLRVNQLCGTVSLLYGFLLHSGAPVRDENVPLAVPQHTLDVALEIIRFLNYIAILDIQMIQSILGGEGLSLQIRHLCSYLIWYCSHHISNSNLLHEVTLLIGNFVVLNVDNQTLLQSGQRPTVVQQLCSLPFEYFSDDSLKQLLFPTLIAACFQNGDNAAILKQEMSTTLLSEFIDSAMVSVQVKNLLDKTTHNDNQTIVDKKWAFAMRFPKNRWSEAKFYFVDRK